MKWNDPYPGLPRRAIYQVGGVRQVVEVEKPQSSREVSDLLEARVAALEQLAEVFREEMAALREGVMRDVTQLLAAVTGVTLGGDSRNADVTGVTPSNVTSVTVSPDRNASNAERQRRYRERQRVKKEVGDG